MIGRNRFIPAFLRGKGLPEAVVIIGGFCVDGDGAANELNRGVAFSDLDRENAELMQRVGMSGLLAQDLIVKHLRLGEMSGLVRSRGLGENVLNVRFHRRKLSRLAPTMPHGSIRLLNV